jgi:hypothetical protein
MELAARRGPPQSRKTGWAYLVRTREREILRKVSGRPRRAGGYARILFSNFFARAARTSTISARRKNRWPDPRTAAGAQTYFPGKGPWPVRVWRGLFPDRQRQTVRRPGHPVFPQLRTAFSSAVEGGLSASACSRSKQHLGSVNEYTTRLRRTAFSSCRAQATIIDHALLAKPGTPLDQVKESFPRQALGQCSEYLSAHKYIRFHSLRKHGHRRAQVAESPPVRTSPRSPPKTARPLYGLSLVSDRVQTATTTIRVFTARAGTVI